MRRIIGLHPSCKLLRELLSLDRSTRTVLYPLTRSFNQSWLWKRDNGSWSATKVIEIPAEPADPDLLPPLLQGFKAVPPLVTDINLSLDDKWLYVSCWGTGELRRYDVSVPDRPDPASVIQLR